MKIFRCESKPDQDDIELGEYHPEIGPAPAAHDNEPQFEFDTDHYLYADSGFPGYEMDLRYPDYELHSDDEQAEKYSDYLLSCYIYLCLSALHIRILIMSQRRML